MTLGEKILALRKEKNWSQHQLAKELSTHGALIGKYERNESKPSIDVAKKIANIFQVSLDYLADNDNKVSALKNKKVIERIADIEKLNIDEKNHIYYLIDAVIRDAKTRKAYSE
ncbi:MAG TPA: helix-turn-helix transcriptional regulator [Spirochaetota bacterium]|nr:helix-turn-helix transcriptional regulator [Spirochaetota bacterium]